MGGYRSLGTVRDVAFGGAVASLRDFQNSLAQVGYGMTYEEAWANMVCISCKKTVDPTQWAEIDRREYFISALCPDCFPEDEDDG